MNKSRRLFSKPIIWLGALCLTAIAITATSPSPTFANPKGGQVVGGQATISAPDTKTLHVNQATDKAIINWQSFNIGKDETTRFFQPSRNSITLNRVIGSQDPSKILGTLRANGNIVIVNPDGIIFGRNARIDVGGLIATTSDIKNSDFMAGRMNFTIPGNPTASIVNLGNISVADYGVAALVAPGVRNDGVIGARFGKVSMAAANGFTLDLYGDGLINLVVGDEIAKEVIDVETGKPMGDLVKNSSRLSANGGVVGLTAATARRAVNSVINNTGVIEARSISRRGGRIILGARTTRSKRRRAPRQIVKVSGRIDASGTKAGEKGGHISVLGEVLELAGATITASGHSGGGTVLIGGDYKGGNGDPETIAHHAIGLEADKIPTASTTTLGRSVTINADALSVGKGGKIIVWSDGVTTTAAMLTARGGALGGDGGFIETSGYQRLDVTATADASAVNGSSGTWLLDPTNLFVTFDTIDVLSNFASDPNTHVALADVSQIAVALIEAALNAGTSVSLLATGNINVIGTSAVPALLQKTSGGDATLTAIAGEQINLQFVNFTSTAGKLNLSAFAPNIILNSVNASTNGGSVFVDSTESIAGNADILAFNSVFTTAGGNITFLSSGSGINNTAICLISTMFNTIDPMGGEGGNIAVNASDGSVLLFKPGIPLGGSLTYLSGGGDIDITSNSFLRIFNETLDSSGGNISLTGASVDVSGDIFGVSDIKTGGGDLVVASTGSTLVFNNIEIGFAQIDAGTGTINLTSTGDVIFFGPDPAGPPSIGPTIGGSEFIPAPPPPPPPAPIDTPIVVSSGALNITAAGLIGIDFFQMNTGDVNLTADIISGGGRNAGIPDIVSSGNVILNGAGIGLFMQGQSDKKLTANYTGGAVANTFDFYAFTGGCSGGECYSLIKETGFGTVELVKTAGFSATNTDIRVEGDGGDFIGAVLNSSGFHFKDVPGFNLMAQPPAPFSNGPPGVTNTKGVTVANAGLFRFLAGNSGIFFDSGAFNVGSQLSFKEVTNVNGGAPDPFFSVLPFSGSGQAFLNGVQVGPDPVPPTPTPPASVTPTIANEEIGQSSTEPDARLSSPIYYGPVYSEFEQSVRDLWSANLSPSEAAPILLPYAQLSAAAYDADKIYVQGWKKVKTWEQLIEDAQNPTNLLETTRLEIAIRAMKLSGFYAAVYEKDGEYALVFRGTQKLSLPDIVIDVLQLIAGPRTFTQYDFANIIADFAVGQFGSSKLTLTGHSLGGGLAQYVASKNPTLKAVTFNAAGIGGPGYIPSNLQNVTNVRAKGDPVSVVGRQLGSIKYEYGDGSGGFDHPIKKVISDINAQRSSW